MAYNPPKRFRAGTFFSQTETSILWRWVEIADQFQATRQEGQFLLDVCRQPLRYALG
jgi:hypothetical protein